MMLHHTRPYLALLLLAGSYLTVSGFETDESSFQHEEAATEEGVSSNPPPKPRRENIVYHVGTGSLHEVHDNRGIWPREMSRNDMFRLPDTTSMHKHVLNSVHPGTGDRYGYISTTANYTEALEWLNTYTDGYIYEIHATPNFINVDQTLLQFNHQRSSPVSQDEFAALGGIHAFQIIGCRWVRHIEAPRQGKRIAISNDIPNPEYDPNRVANKGWVGGKPELAGFSRSHDSRVEGLGPWCQGRCPFVEPVQRASHYLASVIDLERDSIKLHFRLSKNAWAGSDDKIQMQFGASNYMTVFRKSNPGDQWHGTVDPGLFEGIDLNLGMIANISILTLPGTQWLRDRFEVDGFFLEAKTYYGDWIEMKRYDHFGRKLKGEDNRRTIVWSDVVELKDWKRIPGNRPQHIARDDLYRQGTRW
ncbi:heat-labile enterotoxin subunit alpha [Ophiocordyceps camponoti-floridani]|uniref:Heat-labile enterotoxin subunit alpha n=1 Tax=Ophiocordyceps camponoti-floridani TaxID=2030778 RepID=A0A8H4QA97_9HYPO|nr:heat-labile enterotoxin subunit alpha [Ophiocordyceps camponoti-floridani]